MKERQIEHRKTPLSPSLRSIRVVIKGAGEMASAVAWRLFKARIRRICMLEVDRPLAIRRRVSFCEAIYDDSQTLEGVTAVKALSVDQVHEIWRRGRIAVMTDAKWRTLIRLKPDVVVDAILAKRNLGTSIDEANVVVGLGPGFTAGIDVDYAIETHRGHNLGRVITMGAPMPDTGIPGNVGGMTLERVLRAPGSGRFQSVAAIGDRVKKGDPVGTVTGLPVSAGIDGILRGLIRSGTEVTGGLKIGDVDPRGISAYCDTISDKARTISGSVLEAILRRVGHP